MSRFRERPLTWLFLIATACIDVACVRVFWEAEWFQPFLLGQALALGGWLALGRTHRLGRAATVVAMILALAAPDLLSPRMYAPSWIAVVTLLSIYVGLTAVAAIMWSIAIHRGRDIGEKLRGVWARYTVRELLGWTTLVAVVAAVAKHMDQHSLFLGSGWDFLGPCALTCVTALLIAQFLSSAESRSPWVSLAALFCAAIVIAVFVFYFGWTHGGLLALGSYAYVAAWLLVQRLDEARLNKVNSSAPLP